MVVAAIFVSTASVMAEADDLVITTSDRELNLCVGESHELKVYANDPTGDIVDFEYQWYYSATAILTTDDGWTEVTSATDSIYSLTNVTSDATPGNAGYYYCVVRFGYNWLSFKKSERINVRVASSVPSVGSVSVANSVCEGSPINMHADNVQGFQSRIWYHGDEVVAHGAAYNVSAAVLANAGEYTFVATNACGETVMGPYAFAVTELPRIVTQPRSAGICEGEDLHFVVQATGSELQYQWYYDNAPYSAANGTDTNDTLVIAQAVHDPSSYSNTFSVQVSNSCATVTSINVGTIVSEMPNIVGNPESGTYCSGVQVSLSADATTSYPTDTMTYQWYLDDVAIEGATTNIISFAMDSAHMGNFHCEFTNGCGTVSSTTASLVVKMVPTVETQPLNKSVCEGDATQLFAKITGFDPIQYTWLKDNGSDPTYTDVTMQNVSGVHTSTLVINPASEAHEHFYYCYATNECGSVRTDTVYVTVNQHVSVYPSLPSNISVCSGTDTVLSVADYIYEGSTSLTTDEFEEAGITFAWHRQGDDEILSDGPSLELTDIDDSHNGYFVCDITNSCGTITEGPILVSVILSPEITTQPQDIDVCTGGPAFSVSLVADGDNLRYSWYRDGVYLGTNAPTYTAPTVATEYGGSYNCVVASELGCPTAYSDTIMVSIGTTPEITWQPTPAVMAICEGEEYALRMRATGDGIHYQWYNNGVEVAGQTTDSLHLASVTRNNSGEFYCIVSNACADIQTEHAHLTVNNAPDMTLGPDINACDGQDVVLEPQGEDEYAHYSWNFGTYGYQPTLTVRLGGTYILEVSDSAHGNCVARDTVRVVFHDYFDIAFDSTPIVTCGEFVLNAGEGAAEYLWSTTDITSSITVGMNGFYMVTVDGDGYGCTTSAGVNVTIGEEIEIDLGDDITISEDSIVEIGVPSIFESYHWNTGYTGPTLTIDGSEYGVGLHTFWIEVSNGECSAVDSLTINFLESSIEEESVAMFSIYPNPASDQVNIVSSNGTMNEIQIYDVMGRLVMNEMVDSEFVTLNVDSMVNATYFVRILYNDGKASVSKLVIE